MRGIDYSLYVNDVTIYTPIEYPRKTKNMLFSKELKQLQFLIIDEGRLVVRAKNWHSFINQVIADIFAMQRKVKRLFIIINTQSLQDIDKDLRRRITFWGTVNRPLHHKPRLYLARFWDDTRDPENIKLKKRNFRGMYKQNKKIRIVQPPFIAFGMPNKKIWKIYDENSYKAKAAIIKKKLDALMEKMQAEFGEASDRLNSLFNFYSEPKRRQELLMHGKINRKGEFRLKKDAIELFQLNKEHAKEFNLKVTQMLDQEVKKQNEAIFNVSEEEI